MRYNRSVLSLGGVDAAHCTNTADCECLSVFEPFLLIAQNRLIAYVFFFFFLGCAERQLDMDEALERAFLLALHTTVNDKELPMLVSTLSGQHISPAFKRLEGVLEELNVKQTKHKKLGAFLVDRESNGRGAPMRVAF